MLTSVWHIRTLLSLDVSQNKLGACSQNKPGAVWNASANSEVLHKTRVIIADAFRKNTTLSSLNISKNCLGVEGGRSYVQDKGALEHLIFSGDYSSSTPVVVEVGMTEADFSGAQLGPTGVTILAAWVQHKCVLSARTAVLPLTLLCQG